MSSPMKAVTSLAPMLPTRPPKTAGTLVPTRISRQMNRLLTSSPYLMLLGSASGRADELPLPEPQAFYAVVGCEHAEQHQGNACSSA